LGAKLPHALAAARAHDRLYVQLQKLRDGNRFDEALALVEATIAAGDRSSQMANLLVDTLICAGRYLEALSVTYEPAPDDPDDAFHSLLVEINKAEAEYNLGRWDTADARLRLIDERSQRFPLTRASLLQQRAWIAAHQSRSADGLALTAQADASAVPRLFLSELHFTSALLLLALGQLDAASDAAAQGSALQLRASSGRNALFILARVAGARGEWAAAEALCRRAAEHSYRGQGGDGLLFWGDALARLQRGPEAREAWQLAIARDAQSESAQLAAARLLA